MEDVYSITSGNAEPGPQLFQGMRQGGLVRGFDGDGSGEDEPARGQLPADGLRYEGEAA